ncbi:DUF2795 domain-containing protein [Amycolatopsis pigmentata]|uniref:DUF2795 domain-containing protein n=1 Tax=Amycolatopsis pigmentata TaxID=450801 RepID=A0ABW5FTU8_9PSEU
MSKINPIAVQKALSGVDYPCGRDDLIEAAKSNSADSEVLDNLRKLPDESYEGPDRVNAALAGV